MSDNNLPHEQVYLHRLHGPFVLQIVHSPTTGLYAGRVLDADGKQAYQSDWHPGNAWAARDAEAFVVSPAAFTGLAGATIAPPVAVVPVVSPPPPAAHIDVPPAPVTPPAATLHEEAHES
jgi:hypothetical protein